MISKEIIFAGVAIKAKINGNYARVSKPQLTKILLSGNVAVKCNGRYTDDYLYDNAVDYGITELEAFDSENLRDAIQNGWSREHGMGVVYSICNWYAGLYSASIRLETGELVFYCGSNESYTICELFVEEMKEAA